MKSIYLVLLKKRWFIFLSVILVTFLMNLFLWNESSQLIRAIPTLETLKKESHRNSYELRYQFEEQSGESSIVKLSSSEKEELYAVFHSTFLENQTNPVLFYNRLGYINGEELLPVTEAIVKDMILGEQLDILLMEDFVIREVQSSTLQAFMEQIGSVGLPIEIVSFKDTYNMTRGYYIENFRFGLISSMVFFLAGIILLRWILKTSFRLCSDEIKVLRILGMTKKKLSASLAYFLLFPVVIGFLLFLCLVYQMMVGMIYWDYLYLAILNVFLSVLVFLFSRYEVKKAC